MQGQNALIDKNGKTTLIGESSSNPGVIARVRVDEDSGAVATYLAQRLAGEDVVNDRTLVESRWQYSFYDTPGQKIVSIASGILHSIVVGDVGGSGWIVVKDSADGMGNNNIITLVPHEADKSVILDVPFTEGLSVEIHQSGGNAMKVTVLFRENA